MNACPSENSNKKDMTKEKKRFFELTCFGCIVSLNKATFLYQHKLGISFMPIMIYLNTGSLKWKNYPKVTKTF